MESPRLWSFENRLKLLGIVLLVYAFLLSLLEDVSKELREVLLRLKCHRTEKLSYRFTGYDGHSVAFGTTITQLLGAFSLQIWRPFRFWHL